ncbi:hypothetical protein B0H17DRAFT_1189671 [Mycena rosella]|uniref:HAT C-terminal dimerisation domain-containing protein n=1 Tax=Mycena rosella TaxID=1033263 RepID=A0AAD7AZ16_MYCRO|nr:hypothetical protein B0H17DRAFT_1189671 [Mycena rosella]
MSAFARERIKKAHKGRETRGVLVESTIYTVGVSSSSIISVFASSLFLLFPFLACLSALAGASYHLSLSWSSTLVLALRAQSISTADALALGGYLYVYWCLICIYFHSVPKPFTIFINGAQAGSLIIITAQILAVTPMTTVSDIREALCHERHASCDSQGPIYLLGRRLPLIGSETMSDLGVHGLRHFIMPPRLLGGANILDPRFNYKKLRKDYANDYELAEYLETQKAALRVYFDTKYPPSSSTSAPTTPASKSATRPGVINFAAYDQGSDNETENDEIERYFEAPRAPWDTDPVQWRYARKTEFPRSAVAVERVFSGGRDTISLRRASLKPETIRTLMLLKHHLRLKRKGWEDALRLAQAL